MIEEFVQKHNLPKYRVQQFNRFFYKEAGTSFEGLSTWSKDLRELLAKEVDFTTLVAEKELVSKRKDTIKVLFTRKLDGQRIETVLMRHADGRNTVCVSCMVGCPVNCSFCATGKMGFGGNLTAREIIDQIMYFERYLRKHAADINGRDHVTNIVFMGMGEPMLNIKNVEESIAVISDPDKLAMSNRRITISTSGYVPQFKKLIQDGFRGRVAISLHAPNQELRAKMMPVAKLFPLDQLVQALDEYTAVTNKRVSYEYVMIKGLNDQDVHAEQLVELFANRLAHINLIPYNPITEANFERSNKDQIRRFTRILEAYEIPYSIRVTMGDDVNAACGQLADRENKKNLHRKIV